MSTAPAVEQSAPAGRLDARRGRWAQARADLALLAVTVVWGTTFVMVKDALAAAGPFTFLAVRFTLAALVMAPLLVAGQQRRAWSGRLTVAGAAVGVALFAGYAFQTVGLQFTTPARAAFITGISVVLVPLISAAVLRRSVGRGAWIGVALAACGLASLSLGPDLLAGAPLFQGATAAGDLIVFGCALAFAAHIVLVGEISPRHGTMVLTLAQIATAAVLGALFAAVVEHPTGAQVLAILPPAAFTGVVATVLAFTVQVRAQRFTTATHTALIFSAEPVFGALSAYLLIGETLSPLALAGCGLILAGMLVAQLGE